MSVVSITPIPGGEHDSDPQSRRYRQQYLVVCNSDTDDHLTIRASSQFIALTSGHYIGRDGHEDLGAFVERVRIRNMADLPQHSELELEFSTFGDSEGTSENDPDTTPLDRTPEISFDWIATKEVFAKAYNQLDLQTGEFIQPDIRVENSAGEQFNPAAEQDVFRPLVRITRNESFIDPLKVWAYSYKMNAFEFWGAPAYCLLLMPIKTQRQKEQGRFFWPVTYELVFNPQTWIQGLLDIGSYYWPGGYQAHLDDPDLKPKDFLNAGSLMPKLNLLDGFGDKLTPGADPLYLSFAGIQSRDFGDLNLPDPDVMVFPT